MRVTWGYYAWRAVTNRSSAGLQRRVSSTSSSAGSDGHTSASSSACLQRWPHRLECGSPAVGLIDQLGLVYQLGCGSPAMGLINQLECGSPAWASSACLSSGLQRRGSSTGLSAGLQRWASSTGSGADLQWWASSTGSGAGSPARGPYRPACVGTKGMAQSAKIKSQREDAQADDHKRNEVPNCPATSLLTVGDMANDYITLFWLVIFWRIIYK